MGLQMPQDSLFGVGIQVDGSGTNYERMAAGYENPTGTIHYFPLTDCDVGLTKTQDQLPPEIGGKALALGNYVTGVWGGGTASLIPRLSNRLGWLLLATTGSCSTVQNTKASDLTLFGGGGATTAGVHSHIFTFASEAEFFAPWITMHRLLPHATAAERVGELLQDGRIGTFTYSMTSGAPVTVDLGVVGRRLQDDPEFDFEPGWSATYDDFSTFAVPSCDGYFKVGGEAFATTAVSVTVNNNVLPPMQSVVVGSVDPMDFPLLTRDVTVTATVLVDNYDLYVSTFAGADVDVSEGNDATSSCTVYGADLDVMSAAQTFITGTEPYRLRIVTPPDGDSVKWQVQPLRVTPGQPVVLQMTGTVAALADSAAFYMVLQNAQSGYSFV